jgi:RecA-family ATPase
VPVPYRKKRPIEVEWQLRSIDASNAAQYFNGAEMNIGVVLGVSSGGLTDVDLDAPEAVAIGPYILPKTAAIFGRASKRASHRLYYSDLSVTADKAVFNFNDPITKERLLELRIGGFKGAQTIFPGSIHEEGEAITWEKTGEPAKADDSDLSRRVAHVAAYALIARHWPKQPGSRHDCALVLGGFLARAGRSSAHIKVAAEAITRAAGDEEWRDRRKAAEDAAIAYQSGKNAHGLNSLRKTFGDPVAEQVAEWLNYAENNADAKDAKQEPYNQEEQQAPAPLRWLDMSTWDDEPRPQREWAILNRVPLKQAGLFSGEGGTGKSIIEMMKDVAHVAGKDWMGSLPGIGPAFYIGAEDDEKEIHIRFYDIAAHYGVTFKELLAGGLHVLCKLGEDATLCAANSKSGKVETTNFYRQIYEAAGDIKPKNISIDTLSRAFAGNEIDRVQVYAFAMHMQALAMVANGSLTVLSHPSLQGISSGSGISGSTAWHGAFRFRQYLKGTKPDSGEQPDSDLRELEFKKNQYGPLGETVVVRYRNGLFLPVAGMSGLDKIAHEAQADDVFLDLLKRFAGEGRNVSEKPAANNYAPTSFAKEAEAKKIHLRSLDLENAMRRLFANGKIHVENYGRPSRSYTRLAIKEGGS